MLSIRDEKHLLAKLSMARDAVDAVLDSPDRYYQDLWLWDPAHPEKKPRTVLRSLGKMSLLQSRLFRMVLKPKLSSSPYSHGGIPRRSIITNASHHIGQQLLIKFDISDCYPSIDSSRIYHLFLKRFKCSPGVARLCTKICTYRRHLALGLSTSPILAEELLVFVDKRIASLCSKHGLVYTRFVDDITISGPPWLEKSGLFKVVEEVIRDNGFSVNRQKTEVRPVRYGANVTGVRVRRRSVDVSREFLAEFERQLEDAVRLAANEEIEGPYYTKDQVLGRLHHACWVNRKRRNSLRRKFFSVDWARVEKNAADRKLVPAKKTTTLPHEYPKWWDDARWGRPH